MRLVAISDTHSYHRKIKVPDGDVLIHAGDITWRGEINILYDFCAWMYELPHQHKIVVSGNHELGMQNGVYRNHVLSMMKNVNIHYLEDSGITINNLFFWGSPWQPAFFDWEWNLPRNGLALEEKWSLIPDDTNILITHGPPNGILDSTRDNGPQGCEKLEKRIRDLSKLKVHIFGHMHRDGGKMIDHLGVKFVNAAICTDAYTPTNPSVIIDI